jgi:hypothetical protein
LKFFPGYDNNPGPSSFHVEMKSRKFAFLVRSADGPRHSSLSEDLNRNANDDAAHELRALALLCPGLTSPGGRTTPLALKILF